MKIVIAAGGSGGHLFPALSVARQLKTKNHQIAFVSTAGMASERIKQDGFDCANLHAKGMCMNSVTAFFDSALCMIKATAASYGYLKNQKPDAVIGFGGYGAFPTVLAASLLGYPTLIHEQNVIPGKANFILSKIVKRIAVSFKESRRYFNGKKTVWTGCPTHIELPKLPKEEVLLKFNLLTDKLTILVLGGSQGSHAINEKFFEAAILLKEILDFQVIHISGKLDYENLKKKYENAGIVHRVFDFLNEIGEGYAAADIVISRGGAVTISEIAMFGLPAILIPYPFAGGHQKENARVLCGLKTARMIEEKDLSAQRLKGEILAVTGSTSALTQIKQSMKDYFPRDAVIRLTEAILSLSKCA